MNEILQKFAKEYIKKNLVRCTDQEQLRFKRIYSHDNLDLPIEPIIDSMSGEKLDWAMIQIQRTLDKKK